jgi:predicted nucleic acid-binding protein
VSLVVLDTDVASFSLRNRLPDQFRAALAGHTMCITFVTVGELSLAVLAAPDCDTDLVAYEMSLLAEAVGDVLTPTARAQALSRAS